MLTGILGGTLLLIAWILEARKIYKSKNLDGIDERFIAVYLVGSVFLTIYAAEQKDLVFILLGGAITLLNIIELVIVYMRKH